MWLKKLYFYTVMDIVKTKMIDKFILHKVDKLTRVITLFTFEVQENFGQYGKAQRLKCTIN